MYKSNLRLYSLLPFGLFVCGYAHGYAVQRGLKRLQDALAAAGNPAAAAQPVHRTGAALAVTGHSFFCFSIMSITATHGGGPSFGQAFSNPTSITCSTGWSMYGMSGIRARPAPRHTWSQPHRRQLCYVR